MAEFLVEVLSEEIPAGLQTSGSADFLHRLLNALPEAGIKAVGLTSTSFSTPRRIGCVIDGLPLRTPATREERRGPRVEGPDAAIAGFLKANGLSGLDACERRATDKGEFWFRVIEHPGQDTDRLLARILAAAMSSFTWPRSMRFAGDALTWVRPVRSVLALFAGRVLPGGVSLGNHVAGRPATWVGCAGDTIDRVIPFTDLAVGCRFPAADAIRVTGWADYKAAMAHHQVVLDREERKARIEADAHSLASGLGLRLRADPGLVEEIAGLVERPVTLSGGFDPGFLSVPAEILTATMRANQKYLALETDDGQLAPYFVVVTNIHATDGGSTIVRGNERVLRARLADARFFWEQDQKVLLADRVLALTEITFHAQLGSVGARAARIQALSAQVARAMGLSSEAVGHVTRAASLAKADLVTATVGEFPELQGVVGARLAEAEGEPKVVAQAIATHYRPLGPGDKCPSDPVSVALALADKIEMLAGFFLIGERPTGSRDPHGLRRAGLGLIRLIVENQLRLPLIPVIKMAVALLKADGVVSADEGDSSKASLEFLLERLKVISRGQGTRHDLLDAALAAGQDDDLLRILARVAALQRFVTGQDGVNFLAASRRALNILRIEAEKDKKKYTTVEPSLLNVHEERMLWDALMAAGPKIDFLINQENFEEVMRIVSNLRSFVDVFFEKVIVNDRDPDVRKNRLGLLSRILQPLQQIADIARIEG